MSGLEVAGLVIGVATGLVPLLEQGRRIVISYRLKRRLRLQNSGTTPLVDEIKRSESEIGMEYENFNLAYGRAFQVGDDVARDGLKDLIIVLQRDLISVLLSGLSRNRLDNPRGLVDVTWSNRSQAISILSSLAQRIAISQAIAPRLTLPGHEPDRYTPPPRRSSTPDLKRTRSASPEPKRVTLRRRNMCGKYRCERECDRECPNCAIRDTDTVCSYCGECDYCHSYYGEDIKPGDSLVLTTRCGNYGCDAVDCTDECPECSQGTWQRRRTVCPRCGDCSDCRAHFGRV